MSTKAGVISVPIREVAYVKLEMAIMDWLSRRLVINHKHVHVGFDAC